MRSLALVATALSSLIFVSAGPIDIESEVKRVNADMNLVPAGTQTRGTESSAPTVTPEPVSGASSEPPLSRDFVPKDQYVFALPSSQEPSKG
ncbi:MAG: hypothetical protein MMC23_004962 [Stictis urceolatum]|nr:hypothetical protein [Stictis urceolata]